MAKSKVKEVSFKRKEVALDDWQKELIDCKARRILLCKGRQIGGTFTFSRKAAMRLVSQKGCRIIVSSITEEQAQLVIVMVLDYLESHYPKLLKKPYSRNQTKSIINLTTGSSIKSRPVGATGNSIRGFTGDILYLNEVSRMPEFVLEAAKAILLTTDGEIWMDSTPFGEGTYFHRAFINKANIWKVFYHTSEEVMKNRPISETWTQRQRDGAFRTLKEEREEMTKLQYQQEYLGLFVGGIQRFFPDELIDSCCVVSPGSNFLSGGDPVFQGIDIARMGGDETVLVSLKKNETMLSQVDMEIPEGQRLTDTARLIIHKDEEFNHKRIYIDDGGMGVGVYDILYEHFKGRKVVAINNARRGFEKEIVRRPAKWSKTKERKTTLLKTDLYNNLKNLMENNKIRLFNSPELRQSLRSIQYENTDGVLKIYGNYSHIAEALIRAAWCVKDKHLKLWVASKTHGI